MHATRANHDELGVFALMATALAIKPFGTVPLDRGRPAPETRGSDARTVRRSLLERLDDWCWKHEQREREAYLAQSKDVYDLEARIRDLERGVMYRYS